MHGLCHSRKTSLDQQLATNILQNEANTKIYVADSLQESPYIGSMFWLRSTCYQPKSRYRSDQKSLQKSTLKRGTIQLNKQNGIVNHGSLVAKLEPLQKISNICIQSALYIVQAAIKDCSIHHSRLGYSSFNIKNCYLNHQAKLIINTQKTKINMYHEVTDECIVVRDIIESVHKICTTRNFDDFYSYYKRTSIKNKCDFKYTLSLINSYSICSKIKIGSCVKISQDFNQYGYKDRFQHPKSAQKTSPFYLSNVSAINRRKSFFKYRSDNTYTNLCNSKEKTQRSQNSKFTKTQSLFQKQNQIISINHQFDIVFNPKAQKRQQIKNSQVKSSIASTNFKSSLHHGDSMEASTLNLKGKLPINGRSSEHKQHFSFLPIDLDEVQSLGQSSDQQSQMTKRQFETPRDTLQQTIRKQNQQRILTNNNWTRRLNGLLLNEQDVKLSFTQDINKQNIRKADPDPQNLRKMARAVVDSILPCPSQFYVKNS